MLPQTDQGSFFKYLSTLGVAVVAASLGATGFILRTQSDLLVDRKKLNELTSTAREAIQEKQKLILWITRYLPTGLLICTLFGCLLVCLGLWGWKRRQNIADERDKVELKKLYKELEQVDDKELEKHVEFEAIETIKQNETEIVGLPRGGNKSITKQDRSTLLGGKKNAPPAPSVIHENELLPPGNVDSVSQREVNQSLVNSIKSRIQSLQGSLIRKLELDFADCEVLSAVRLEKDSDDLVDAVVIDQGRRRVFLFKLKYLLGDSIAATAQTAMTLTKNAERLHRDFPGFRIIPAAILISDNFSSIKPYKFKHHDLAIRLNMKYYPIILSYSPKEFREIPPKVLRTTVRDMGLYGE